MAARADRVYIYRKDDVKDEGEFQVSFVYQDEKSGIKRNMHFNRSVSEPVYSMLARIHVKISQCALGSKKRKRTQLGAESTCPAKVNPNVQEHPLNVCMTENGFPVSDKSCAEVFFNECSTQKDLILHIGANSYQMVVNYPWICNIALTKRIMVGFATYPYKFEAIHTEKKDSEYTWYRIPQLPYSTPIAVGSGPTYTPVGEDAHCKLKLVCVPKKGHKAGPEVEVLSHCLVESGPTVCPFEDRHRYTAQLLRNDSFRVVTYNILADMYAESNVGRTAMFKNCPSEVIDIDYRKLLLLKEVTGYNADIICMQEVDASLYERDLQYVLQTTGLEGVFYKKGGSVREGIATFYRKSRFRLLGDHSYILSNPNSENAECLKDIWQTIFQNESLKTRFIERTTVFQALILQSVDTENILIVGNTHLYFHPDADHIRLLQGGMIVSIVENMVNKLIASGTARGRRISVVLCGDFNSTPDCGIYQLYTEKKVSAKCPDWASNEKEAVSNFALKQPFLFGSACGTPEFTNYTNEFSGCLDYIYYQKDHFDVQQSVPLLGLSKIKEYGGLPNVVFPSDHLALVADLKWKSL